MRKGPGSVYDKWNISVVICDKVGPLGSVASLLAATIYRGNPDRKQRALTYRIN